MVDSSVFQSTPAQWQASPHVRRAILHSSHLYLLLRATGDALTLSHSEDERIASLWQGPLEMRATWVAFLIQRERHVLSLPQA